MRPRGAAPPLTLRGPLDAGGRTVDPQNHKRRLPRLLLLAVHPHIGIAVLHMVGGAACTAMMVENKTWTDGDWPPFMEDS